MEILAVYPLGKRSFIVRHRCGYYLDTGAEEMHRMDTEAAHDMIIGVISTSDQIMGATASGEFEAK